MSEIERLGPPQAISSHGRKSMICSRGIVVAARVDGVGGSRLNWLDQSVLGVMRQTLSIDGTLTTNDFNLNLWMGKWATSGINRLRRPRRRSS